MRKVRLDRPMTITPAFLLDMILQKKRSEV